jgi:hypothetical protein
MEAGRKGTNENGKREAGRNKEMETERKEGKKEGSP